MAKLSMECKKLMVKEIGERLKTADTFIITNYRGLTAQDLNDLRKELRVASGDYLVVKDSMAKKAVSEGPNSKVLELIEGEIGIAIDREKDPARISKVLTKFSKDHEVLKICGGIMNGELLSIQDIKTLAALPSREVLLGNLANVLNAPIQGLAGALNAIICKILYALNAIKDKKEKQEDKTKTEEPKAEVKAEDKKEEQQPEKKEQAAEQSNQEPTSENKEDQNG